MADPRYPSVDLYSIDLRRDFSVGQTLYAYSDVPVTEIQAAYKIPQPCTVVEVTRRLIIVEHQPHGAFFGGSTPWREAFDRFDVVVRRRVRISQFETAEDEAS